MRESVVRCIVREDQDHPGDCRSGNRPSAPRSPRWPKGGRRHAGGFRGRLCSGRRGSATFATEKPCARQRYPEGRRCPDLRRQLSRTRRGEDPWPEHRPRGGGAGGSWPDVGSGALSLDEAYQAIDLDTITLLLGTMIVVVSLRLSGFFCRRDDLDPGSRQTPGHPVMRGHGDVGPVLRLPGQRCDLPRARAAGVGVDARRMGRKPLPYLLAVAMASNVGSTATITGNPQNIMIGSFSQIPYRTFTATLAPVAVIGLVMTAGLIFLLHRREFAGATALASVRPHIRVKPSAGGPCIDCDQQR